MTASPKRKLASVTLDATAVKIAKLYAESNESFVLGISRRLLCGLELKAQRDKLAKGEWTPWLKKNEKLLGFGKRKPK